MYGMMKGKKKPMKKAMNGMNKSYGGKKMMAKKPMNKPAKRKA